MSAKKSWRIWDSAFLYLVWSVVALAQVELQYQSRGNRYEGIKPRPVAGYDIELISARADYKEEAQRLPDRLKVKFYLEQLAEVHLIVRELDYKYYYWLDNVRPSTPWRPGFNNGFEWPTRDVIQHLDGIDMYDLAIVARLEKPGPSQVEHVAPVVFYHSNLPEAIQGYLFTFRTNSDARLTCSVYREGVAQPVFTIPLPRQRGGRPFNVHWNSSQAAQGSYRLMLHGYDLNTNTAIDQVVRFRHQPSVSR
jgi:hypothetical protein